MMTFYFVCFLAGLMLSAVTLLGGMGHFGGHAHCTFPTRTCTFRTGRTLRTALPTGPPAREEAAEACPGGTASRS